MGGRHAGSERRGKRNGGRSDDRREARPVTADCRQQRSRWCRQAAAEQAAGLARPCCRAEWRPERGNGTKSKESPRPRHQRESAADVSGRRSSPRKRRACVCLAGLEGDAGRSGKGWPRRGAKRRRGRPRRADPRSGQSRSAPWRTRSWRRGRNVLRWISRGALASARSRRPRDIRRSTDRPESRPGSDGRAKCAPHADRETRRRNGGLHH